MNAMTDNLPDDIMSAAMEIARIVYGGIDTKSPQWKLCVEAARTIASPDDGTVKVDDSFEMAAKAQEAFAARDAFNKQNPSGTHGIIKTPLGQMIKTRVEQTAMVFPNRYRGQSVMAWFHEVGWKDISLFSREEKLYSVAEELTTLAMQAKQASKLEMSRLLLQAAVSADPKCFHALNEQGVMCSSDQDFEGAVKFYTAALDASPDIAPVLNNRAMAYRSVGRSEEAVKDAMRAMKLLPGEDMIALNCASALDDVGRVDEALAIMYDYAERHPDNKNIHYNLALTLLSAGRFEQGWKEYAWRLMMPSVNSHYEHFDIPRWNGEDVTGKNVLVWGEQGIGDEIITATMLPDLIQIAGHVTVLCNERLVPVYQRSFPTATIDQRPACDIIETFPREPLRPELIPVSVRGKTFDVQMSQGDLGTLFRPNAESFPRAGRFLEADHNATLAFSLALRTDLTEPKKIIGISWHSKRNIRIGTLKSLRLIDFAPILKMPGCTFVNLQYGDCDEEIAEVEKELGVKVLQMKGVDPLADLDAFTALVASMDLVISASNTAVHIAGALGVPTWVMCPNGAGKLWYWHQGTEQSLWYPSVRLFRQKYTSKWDGVIDTIAGKLSEYLDGR